MPNWILFLFGPDTLDIDIHAFNPVAPLILLIPLFLLRRRGKSVGYLLCFSLFFFYLWAVLACTLFPLPVRFDRIDGMRRYARWADNIHLVPAIFSGDFDVRSEQVYGNFLLGVPFGFCLPFVIDATPRRVVALGLGLAAGIELTQLAIGLLVYQAPYRIIDIDDVWLVFTGSLLGYAALRAAAYVYRWLGWAGGARVPGWDHVHAVLLRVAHPPRQVTS